MFGKSFKVELDFDTHELMFIIDDFLRKNGISHFNHVEAHKIRCMGDAGMGIFEIEKKVDRDKKKKLYVEANSPISAEILENLIASALDYIRENELYEVQEEKEEEIIVIPLDNIGADCIHDYHFLKEEDFLGIEVNIFQCANCNKLEFYKK